MSLDIEPREPSHAAAADEEAQRLHERFPLNSPVHLTWQDGKGGQRHVRARAVDASKFGVLVEAEASIPSGTIVCVQTASFTILGKASVRHCTPKGLSYKIGLYMPDRLMRDM
jgi:hypothetical protein